MLGVIFLKPGNPLSINDMLNYASNAHSDRRTAGEDDRHFDIDFLVCPEALEVDMDRPIGDRIELNVAENAVPVIPIAQLQVDDVGFRSEDERLQAFFQDGDRNILISVEVENARDFSF